MKNKRINLLMNEQQLDKILNESSEQYENEIRLKSKRKKYWTKDEIDAIVANHRYLLQETFFNAIHDAVGDENCVELVQKFIYILSKAYLFCDGIITDLFQSDCNGSKIKVSVKEKNINDDVKKNSNIMLKETENVKDVTATVEIDKDLKTVIEQDF